MADPSYLAWCREHQVHMHGVKPAYVAEGWRGVVATQELAPGHVVMTVPQDMLMSVLSAQQDPVLALLLPRQHLSSHQVRWRRPAGTTRCVTVVAPAQAHSYGVWKASP